MKFFAFLFFSSLALYRVSGQETTVAGSNCFLGTVENGTAVEPIVEIACDFSEKSCMTKVEVNPAGAVKTVRECTQTLACQNQAAQNPGKCYPGQNDIRICFFCCRGHLCNEDLESVPEASGSPSEGTNEEVPA